MSAAGRERFRLWAFWLYPRQLPAFWWFVLAAVVVAADVASGPHVQFAAAFGIPILLAAWYSGPVPALALAFLLPLIRLTLALTVWADPSDPVAAVQTAVLRVVVFSLQAFVVARLASHERDLVREVDLLEGLLPICMHCKSIRNDTGEWEPLERYISARSEATFTHGLCVGCTEKHYPELTRTPGPRPLSGTAE